MNSSTAATQPLDQPIGHPVGQTAAQSLALHGPAHVSAPDATIEGERLATVRQLRLVDTPAEERFDKLVRVAQRLFGVSMVEVNLIEADRQFTKAAFPAENQGKNTPREQSFCARTITYDDTLVVPDATLDDRFVDNPLVTGGPGIRFYAGHPLVANGQPVGSLCLVDDTARQLSADEQEMLADLATLVERELVRDAEMVHAATVQRHLLPQEAPQVPGYDVAGSVVTALEVGGDVYGWVTSEDTLSLFMADVMGKGVGAALIAATLRAAIRATFTGHDLGEHFARAAAVVEPDLMRVGTFVTGFAAEIDYATGQMAFVDAGHGLAVVVSPGGGYRRLASEDGLPMGVLPGSAWPVHAERLAPGETLLVLSDGVLDAFTSLDEAFAHLSTLTRPDMSAESIVNAILDAATRGQHDGGDDVTVLAIARNT